MMITAVFPALLFFSFFSVPSFSVSIVEQEALTSLFLSTRGAEWKNNSGWADILVANATLHPCGSVPWFGVSCGEAEDEVVTGLSLPSNNLRGMFPVAPWTGLKFLRTLDLDFNYLNGSTPASVCNLVQLEKLSVRGNDLEGSPVPKCVEHLPKLSIVDFSGEAPGKKGIIISHYSQSLSGTLPLSLCSLERLEILRFQNTVGLHGPIPPCLGGENQPALTTISLGGNHFTGSVPEGLSVLSNLHELRLGNNSMNGSLPQALIR